MCRRVGVVVAVAMPAWACHKGAPTYATTRVLLIIKLLPLNHALHKKFFHDSRIDILQSKRHHLVVVINNHLFQRCKPVFHNPAPPKPRPTFSRDTAPSSIRSSTPDVGQGQAQARPYMGDQCQHGAGTFDFSKKARSGLAQAAHAVSSIPQAAHQPAVGAAFVHIDDAQERTRPPNGLNYAQHRTGYTRARSPVRHPSPVAGRRSLARSAVRPHASARRSSRRSPAPSARDQHCLTARSPKPTTRMRRLAVARLAAQKLRRRRRRRRGRNQSANQLAASAPEKLAVVPYQPSLRAATMTPSSLSSTVRTSLSLVQPPNSSPQPPTRECRRCAAASWC